MAAASMSEGSSLATYQSIVAYDGTLFEGFQRQSEGHRTVQGVLESALRQIGWLGRAVKAAGRTDTGVHAEGQVIAYQFDWEHSTQELSAALNANLPGDVAVRESEKVPEGFHPRFDAISRRYRYSIFIDAVRNPLKERYAWRLAEELDDETLSAAASVFEGEHNFAAFGRPPRETSSTVRFVQACRWITEGSRLELHIEANAFLYHMVRHITAALVDAGQGLVRVSELQELLEDPTRRRQGRLAPAAGLCLVGVTYPQDLQSG